MGRGSKVGARRGAQRAVPCRAVAWALAVVVLVGCSTIEPGSQLSIASITYDENYFYCAVEPKVIIGQSCAAGDSARGESSAGCHASATPFTLRASTAVTCNGSVPTGAIGAASSDNFAAASSEMALEVSSAPFFMRPTQQTAHPRSIFAVDSAEAEIIRQWAKTATH